MQFKHLTPLTSSDFNSNTEFLIDEFLPKHMITMIYADGGVGKSWLANALTKYAANHSMNAVYLDFDNPITVLNERGINEKLIKTCPNLQYIHRSKTDLESMQVLESIAELAVGSRFKNLFLVMDSLQDFIDTKKDTEAKHATELLKNIREAGATILMLHHANKDGRNYEGSNKIKNSIDNMFQVTKVDAPEGQIRWVLTVVKERAAIVDTALSIRVDNLDLWPIDIEKARISSDDQLFIAKAKAAIKEAESKGEKINKTQLLEACGSSKDDKTARDRLDRFTGVHWQSEKKSNVYYYQSND